MRTTVRLEDDLLDELREQAHKENVSLTRLLNRVLRAGMAAPGHRPRGRRRFRQQTHAMGTPNFDLRKALAVAAAMEDDEIVRKMTLRK